MRRVYYQLPPVVQAEQTYTYFRAYRISLAIIHYLKGDASTVFRSRWLNRVILLFIVLVFVLSGCGVEPPADSVPVNEPPVAYIDSISPLWLTAGGTVVFSGYGTDPDGVIAAYRWRSSIDGEIGDEARFEYSLLSEGEHVIYFQVKDESGTWSQEVNGRVVVTRPLPPPVIHYFTVSPDRIGQKGLATLSWYVSGAATVHIDPDIGAVALTGKSEVSPSISTSYTLTASNGTAAVTDTVTVIVIPVDIAGSPVIRTFSAEPGVIAKGDSATLSWDVLNAGAVQIDPGIGVREPAGSVSVSPEETTVYTLTAYGGGIIIGTTQLIVTAGPVAGRPDLVIKNMHRIEAGDGIKIAYTVENSGTGDAPSSITRLYANGVNRASNTESPLAAGTSVDRQFDDWLYNPVTNVITVMADADGNVAESSEGNNKEELIFAVHDVYDFVENADRAAWGTGYPYQSLVFGGEPSEEEGYVVYSEDKRLEDGTGPSRYLVTRPRGTFNGAVIGDYKIDYFVSPGEHFYALMGFLYGSDAGDVEFRVYIREHGTEEWEALVPGIADRYDYVIKSVSVPVPPAYFGKGVDFRLLVSTNGEPLQDRAVWVEAKIVW
jgi:hypothetical protein